MSSYESYVSSPSSPRQRRRLSDASSREELINAFEAEEERIINVLSRKLEQLQRDKVMLERVHEEESESQVNRLSRELDALRRRARAQEDGEVNGANSVPSSVLSSSGMAGTASPEAGRSDLSSAVVLEALRKENNDLRARVVVAEREYVRMRRLNEVYREELIEHRRRMGLSVDSLVGLHSSSDALSQPLHRRSLSAASSSPTAPPVVANQQLAQAVRVPTTYSMPIPRPSTQPHRANHYKQPSIPATPLSHSPSSSADSPFPFSPLLSPNTDRRLHVEATSSYLSGTQTNLTTPNSTSSLQTHPPAPFGQEGPGGGGGPVLTYPSVPPPSLSSSLGSPTMSYYSNVGTQEPSSPIDGHWSLSRRNSLSHGGTTAIANGVNGSAGGRRVVERGNLRDLPRSRRTSVERGGRIAETGSLAGRQNLTMNNAAGNASEGGGGAMSGPASASDSPVLGAFVPSLNETIE